MIAMIGFAEHSCVIFWLFGKISHIKEKTPRLFSRESNSLCYLLFFGPLLSGCKFQESLFIAHGFFGVFFCGIGYSFASYNSRCTCKNNFNKIIHNCTPSCATS